jgi:hypothetical protein
MRRYLSCAIFLTSLVLPALSAVAESDHVQPDQTSEPERPQHWLTQIKREWEANSTLQSDDVKMGSQIKFVFGNNIWQPGEYYKKGDNWLALACTEDDACRFEPAVLDVKKESWQGHYDDVASAGQRLTFKLRKPAAAKVIAWFDTSAAPAWVKPGNVATYPVDKGHNVPGTLDTLVNLPDESTASLVPMLLSRKVNPELAQRFDTSSATILLQLRAQGKRQLLPGVLGSCSQALDNNSSYLLWAGDLDDDGKPDYLISFIDADGPVHLYLSGKAAVGQLVGLAGVHEAPPFGGECDTDGWGM